MAPKAIPFQLPRSRKAGRPPEQMTVSAQARRRERSAHGELRKGGVIFQTGHGPRVAKGVRTPKVKKR